MKKILLSSVFSLYVLSMGANEYSIRPENHHTQINTQDYKLHLADEYLLRGEPSEQASEQEVMLEYEQHVCDNVKPPKISQPVAFLTHIGCYTLIQYLALREKAQRYLVQVKQFLNNCLSYVYTRN